MTDDPTRSVDMTLAEFYSARLDEIEAAAETSRPDPATLMDIAAKRQVVNQLLHIRAGVLIVGTNHPEYVSGLYTAIRSLAQPFADHPDYRQEWAS